MNKTQTVICAGGIRMPVTVIEGARPGPAVLITAGIHGAEYAGIETARRLAATLTPEKVRGRLTILPCVNQAAFRARIPALNPLDGKNINRMFPGNADGTSSEQIAAALTQLQAQHGFYIDMHGGDLHENLSPYVYFQGACDEKVSAAGREACRHVGVPVRIRSTARTGAYNSAAIRGTPSILIERGCAGRWTEADISAYLRDMHSVLVSLGALDPAGLTLNRRLTDGEQTEDEALYDSAPADGLWYPAVRAGDTVTEGMLLGELRTFEGSLIYRCRAQKNGRILYLPGTLFVPEGTDLAAY